MEPGILSLFIRPTVQGVHWGHAMEDHEYGYGPRAGLFVRVRPREIDRGYRER